MEITIKTNVLSLKEEMIVFPKDNIYYQTSSSRNIIAEYDLSILHYYCSNEKT